MSTIDWSKAPEWANAVISSKDGQEFYVSQFGGISARQRVGYCEVDNDHSADMIIPHAWSLVATRRAPWAGEGLPPVGIEFEWRYGDHAWKKGEALYIGSCYVILKARDDEQHYYLRDMAFRPARTPEQIAEEERANGIQEMREAAGSLNNFPFEQLYDAGYRKQVMP